MSEMKKRETETQNSPQCYFVTDKCFSRQVFQIFVSATCSDFAMFFVIVSHRRPNLLQNNVSPGDILRDLDLLARSPDRIKSRLEQLRKHGIRPIKPWMLKCDGDFLDRFVYRFHESQTQWQFSVINRLILMFNLDRLRSAKQFAKM